MPYLIYRNKILILAIALYFVGCAGNEPYQNENKIFFHYLSTFTQNSAIKKGKKEFLVIPSGGCHGCQVTYFMAFKNHIENPNTYVVIDKKATEDLMSMNIPLSDHVLIDTTNQLERQDLSFENPTLIISENGKIKSIHHFAPLNSDSVNVFISN